jgi:hypothetical protein
MKRLLILGDSLSLPRLQPEFCGLEDTWPNLLKPQFQIHQVSLGGGTIGDLFRQVEYHKAFAPDIVVLQSGIVDCAPRALSIFELEFISKIWGIQSIVLSFVKKHSRSIRSWRNKTYTSPSLFSNKLNEIKTAFPNSQLIVVGILPPCQEYEKIVPGVSVRIKQYNIILREVGSENFISLDTISRDCIMSDFIHLNKKGHLFVYEKIMARLTSKEC